MKAVVISLVKRMFASASAPLSWQMGADFILGNERGEGQAHCH
jgi:hypothetical protein